MTTLLNDKTRSAQSGFQGYNHDRPHWLNAELYPFQSRFLEIEGNQIHYVDEGSGPTLLFIHAGPAWSFIYRNFIQGLKDRFRCIALDHPGFGFSSGAKTFDYSLPAYAHIVAEFVQALDLEKITMMVHDSGGPIGFGAADRMPDRFKAFIVSDTFGWPLSDYPKVVRMLKFITSPAFSFLNRQFNLLPWVVGHIAPVGQKLTKAERNAYTDAFPTRESRQRILSLFRDLYRQKDYMRTVEVALKQKLKDHPSLLIYGEKDPVREQGWQTRFEGIFAHHRSVVIAGEGHFPHEGAPNEMIDAIRTWWAEEIEN